MHASAHAPEGLYKCAAEQLLQFLMLDPGQDGRVGNLVAVEMQDRQHGAVGGRIEKLVGMPGGGQRPGLRLAVADDAGDDENDEAADTGLDALTLAVRTVVGLGVVALVAARRGPLNIKKALAYLSRQVSNGAIDAAADYDQAGIEGKIVLAAVAGGKDPHAFGGVDVVQKILDSEQPSGQFGAATVGARCKLGLQAGAIESLVGDPARTPG